MVELRPQFTLTLPCIGWGRALGTPTKQGRLFERVGKAAALSQRGALPMFLAIVISSFVAGTIFGLRFRVFVLGPAILFATVSTVAISFANGLSGGTIILAVLAV